MSKSNKEKSDFFSQESSFSIANGVLIIAGIVNPIIGTGALILNNVAIGGTGLTAGLILILAGTIDRFESLKGLGVEAKTRKLDQAIVEATDVLSQVRSLTELSARSLLDLNARVGRWSTTVKARELTGLAKNVRLIMKEVGSNEKAINEALRPWARIICFDLTNIVFNRLRDLLMEKQRLRNVERNSIADLSGPEYERLSREMNEIGRFIDIRMNKSLSSCELEGFPELILNAIDDAPYIEQEKLMAIRKSAERYIRGMRSLIDNRVLEDEDLWLKTLEDGAVELA